MLLIRKDDIPVYHDKIIISKPGGILPIPPNFNDGQGLLHHYTNIIPIEHTYYIHAANS